MLVKFKWAKDCGKIKKGDITEEMVQIAKDLSVNKFGSIVPDDDKERKVTSTPKKQ